MNPGCTYIKVSNVEKSIDFYTKLPGKQPQYLLGENYAG